MNLHFDSRIDGGNAKSGKETRLPDKTWQRAVERPLEGRWGRQFEARGTAPNRQDREPVRPQLSQGKRIRSRTGQSNSSRHLHYWSRGSQHGRNRIRRDLTVLDFRWPFLPLARRHGLEDWGSGHPDRLMRHWAKTEKQFLAVGNNRGSPPQATGQKSPPVDHAATPELFERGERRLRSRSTHRVFGEIPSEGWIRDSNATVPATLATFEKTSASNQATDG
jgi:hypothetical protein